MDRAAMLEVLGLIGYRNWKFKLWTEDERPCLRVMFPADGEMQFGRKWMLSPHMTRSELVQTALKAVLTAEEHETREHFTYKGAAIFGPHFDVDALVAISGKTDVRPPMPSFLADPLWDALPNAMNFAVAATRDDGPKGEPTP